MELDINWDKQRVFHSKYSAGPARPAASRELQLPTDIYVLVISVARRSCIWVPCRYTSEKSEEGNARRHKRPFLYAARPAGRLSDKISVS